MALATALRKLVENPWLQKKMGVKGRRLAEAEFSIQKVVHDTFSIYSKLLAPVPVARPVIPAWSGATFKAGRMLKVPDKFHSRTPRYQSISR
jgi:hypothetical protein